MHRSPKQHPQRATKDGMDILLAIRAWDRHWRRLSDFSCNYSRADTFKEKRETVRLDFLESRMGKYPFSHNIEVMSYLGARATIKLQILLNLRSGQSRRLNNNSNTPCLLLQSP